MFQGPVIRSLFKGAVCLLFFAGSFILQPAFVSGQKPVPIPHNDTELLKNPTDTVKDLYERHSRTLSDPDRLVRDRLSSLKVLAAMVTAGNLAEKEQISNIFVELVNLVQTHNEKGDPDFRKLREQALKHLPLLTSKWAEHDNTAYETMVSALMAYSSELPSHYQKSWIVTETLSSVLKALSIELKDGEKNDANPNRKRRTFKQASNGLKEMALDPEQDLQVRYNAVNHLITKGDEFLVTPTLPAKDYKFKPKADVTSYYIIVDRLNEIATADDLPPLLLRQSLAALERYLNVKLP